MGVDRIIFLIAIIRVVENHAAPYASDGLTCGGSKWEYLFVLHPRANEADLLTNLVNSATSALVTRSTIDGDSVEVIVSPDDFTEFQKKSQTLKVYKSHSLQCVDEKTNLTNLETNTSRSSSVWTEINRTAKANSSIEATTRLPLNGSKELHEKNCKTPEDCKTEFRKDSIKVSPSKDVEKSLSTILVGSSNSRIPRESKTSARHPKKEASKLKSGDKPVGKLPKGKNRTKLKQQKSAKSNDGRRDNRARKKTKINTENKKTALNPVRVVSKQESWRRLMSMAAKSVMKSNDTSTNSTNAKKVTNTKKSSSKKVQKPKSNSTRKSAVKTKSLSTGNRRTQLQKSVSKTQGRRTSSSARNPTIRKTTAPKNRKGNRKSREISAQSGTKRSSNNHRKIRRSAGHHVKRDFTFRSPMACAVIKISNACDYDCSEDEEASSETVAEDPNKYGVEVIGEEVESLPASEEEGSLSDSPSQSELAPNEPSEHLHEESDSLLMEPRDQHLDNVYDSNSAEPGNNAEYDVYDDAPENNDGEIQPQMPKSPLKTYTTEDYDEPPDPSFDEYSAVIPPVFHPGDTPEYPIMPENPLNQYSSNKPSDQDSWNKPSDQDSGNKPSDQDSWNKPPDQNSWNKPSDQDSWNKPPDQGSWNKPPDQDSGNKPSDQDSWNKPSDQDSWNKPSDQNSLHKPSAPESPFAFPSSATQPVETFNRTLIPENVLKTSPLKSSNEWFIPTEVNPFGDEGEDDEETLEYGEDNDEEYDEEDKEEDEDVPSPAAAPALPQVEKLADFSAKENEMDEEKGSKGDADYDEDDDEDKEEDYGKRDDNQEDYVEDSGNAGIGDEDDYDLDED